MEYEKEDGFTTKQRPESQITTLKEFVEGLNGLDVIRKDISVLEADINSLDHKRDNIGIFISVGLLASVMLSLLLPKALGYDSFIPLLVVMGVSVPTLGLLFLMDEIEYCNPNSKLYKFFKKPKWLVSYSEKMTEYQDMLFSIGMTLSNKELQLELLGYLETEKIYIPLSQQGKYETMNLEFMDVLSKANYVESTLKFIKIVTFINKNRGNEEQVTYLTKLKQLTSHKSNIKKLL